MDTSNPELLPTELSALRSEVAEAVVMSQPREDTILMVCEQTGWDWEQANIFVSEIETENQLRKLARTRLFLWMASFSSILGGLAIFFYMGFLGFTFLRGSMIREEDWLSHFFFFDFLMNRLPFFIGGMLFGLGMIAGGAYGIGKALAE